MWRPNSRLGAQRARGPLATGTLTCAFSRPEAFEGGTSAERSWCERFFEQFSYKKSFESVPKALGFYMVGPTKFCKTLAKLPARIPCRKPRKSHRPVSVGVQGQQIAFNGSSCGVSFSFVTPPHTLIRAAQGSKAVAQRGESDDASFTTVMLRNIPNKYTRAMLIDKLHDAGFRGDIDYLYLPTDFQNRCNVGSQMGQRREIKMPQNVTAKF